MSPMNSTRLVTCAMASRSAATASAVTASMTCCRRMAGSRCAPTAAIDDWQCVVSSPMRRCLEFARWLATERGLPLEVQPTARGRIRRLGRHGGGNSCAQGGRMHDAFYRDGA